MERKVKVGDTVYLFDENHREYTKPKKGDLWGKIIWRKHFVPHKITGETSRSWIVGHWGKIPKHSVEDYCWSEEDIDKREWVKDNVYQVAREVEKIKDYKLLQAVKDLLSK